MESKSVILGTIVLSAGIVTWQGLQDGNINIRAYAGLTVLAFFLLAIGTFAPDLAAAFGVLVFVTLLLARGESLGKLNRLISAKGP